MFQCNHLVFLDLARDYLIGYYFLTFFAGLAQKYSPVLIPPYP